jgi:hypothetical protein
MAWTTPLTAVANATLTAAQWNASVRDNLNMTAPALATASGQIFASTAANTIAVRVPSSVTVNTSEGTASTSYGDLATSGPAVTVTTGAKAIVAVGALHSSSSASGYCQTSYAVSGATTVNAADENGTTSNGTSNWRFSMVSAQTALTPGSNTFTMKYRAAVAGTATFADRKIVVIPL